jgi:hypothetical protein
MEHPDMAAAVGVSHQNVHRIWKDGDLKPQVRPTFKISNDPPTTRPTSTKRCATGCKGTRRMVTHFTPTGSCWVNLVERFFAGLTGGAHAGTEFRVRARIDRRDRRVSSGTP